MTTELKLPLSKKKVPANYQHLPWSSCLPFIDNSRAILIHRPKNVTTYKTFKKPHIGITNYCGNTFVGTDKFTFLASIPSNGKLLCARCEEAAVSAGLPSAYEINGGHVHIGRLKAIRVCCKK